jgi:transposase
MGRITVGVDVGKRTHQVAIYDPALGAVLGQATYPVSRTGFEQLAAFLQQHAPDQADVLVGIEATGHYHVTLVEFLLERGYAVGLVNPYRAAQFRRSQGGKAKNRSDRCAGTGPVRGCQWAPRAVPDGCPSGGPARVFREN